MSVAINRAFLLKNRTTPTEIVDSGEAYFWLEGSSIKYKDDTQTIYTLATGITPEEVEDIIAAFIVAGSSKLSVVYNDAADTLTIDVVESNIIHQNLSGAGTNTHAQIDSHIASTANPHSVTKSQVGLGNVDNTSDLDKPVSTAQATADGVVQAFAIQRANHTGTQTSSTISDFNEAAQDAVGTILTDTASVDLTYNDAANQITATVLPAGVNHDALQNFVANEHIDHSTVSISAGTGLTGGGDITANRTISMPAVGTPATYGSASQVPVITTDAQGRVSAVTNTSIAITGLAVSNTPAGNIAATTVQAAINELDTEKQPIDATLTSLAAYNTNGLLTQTAADTFAGRTLTGTASNISVSNGDGVAGNPTIDLIDTAVTPATYGASGVPQFTVDAKGRITAASNGPALVIGDNFEQFSDLTVFTTTAATNQVVASFTTLAKDVGLYRVALWWDWTYSATTSDAIFSLFIDNVLQDGEFRMELSETVTQNIPFFWAVYINFATIATHTIELRARSEAAGTTTTVNRVRAEIWRAN